MFWAEPITLKNPGSNIGQGMGGMRKGALFGRRRAETCWVCELGNGGEKKAGGRVEACVGEMHGGREGAQVATAYLGRAPSWAKSSQMRSVPQAVVGTEARVELEAALRALAQLRGSICRL